MTRLTACFCCVVLAGSLAWGQDPLPRPYFPLNTPFPPPGKAGDWGARINRGAIGWSQPVEIQLPCAAKVTWYSQGLVENAQIAPAPSMAGLLVGPLYRFRLSELADYPGVELYPSIELVDRLHPPAGRETEFPVAIAFTGEEIEAATQGRLVTKVIYLEQPNRAALQSTSRGRPLGPVRVSPRANPLEVADLKGRPLAIIRLGGRTPDVNQPEPGFYGTGAPVTILQRKAEAEDVQVPASPTPEAPPAE